MALALALALALTLTLALALALALTLTLTLTLSLTSTRTLTRAQVHVYTMGSRSYAQQVVNIIDPDQRLIFGRIMTRKDGEESFIKGLAHIVPNEAERRGCLVLDDRIQAWPPTTLTLTLTLNLPSTLP